MSYQNLEVYKKSYDLALKIHKLSLQLPQYLQYDLSDQIRRASRSIPSNIVEGYTRNQSFNDKKNFLSYALGSCNEMIFNLQFLKDLKMITSDFASQLISEYTICSKQIYQLIKSLKPKNQ